MSGVISLLTVSWKISPDGLVPKFSLLYLPVNGLQTWWCHGCSLSIPTVDSHSSYPGAKILWHHCVHVWYHQVMCRHNCVLSWDGFIGFPQVDVQSYFIHEPFRSYYNRWHPTGRVLYFVDYVIGYKGVFTRENSHRREFHTGMTFWFRIAFTWWLGHFISCYLTVHFMLIKYTFGSKSQTLRMPYPFQSTGRPISHRNGWSFRVYMIQLRDFAPEWNSRPGARTGVNSRRGDSRRHNILWVSCKQI